MSFPSDWNSEAVSCLRQIARWTVETHLIDHGQLPDWHWDGPEPDIASARAASREYDPDNIEWTNPIGGQIRSAVRFNPISGLLEVWNQAHGTDGILYHRLSAEEAAQLLYDAWGREIYSGKRHSDIVGILTGPLRAMTADASDEPFT